MTKVYCSISKTVVFKNFVPKQGLNSFMVWMFSSTATTLTLSIPSCVFTDSLFEDVDRDKCLYYCLVCDVDIFIKQI
jgi:hypothetical protein